MVPLSCLTVGIVIIVADGEILLLTIGQGDDAAHSAHSILALDVSFFGKASECHRTGEGIQDRAGARMLNAKHKRQTYGYASLSVNPVHAKDVLDRMPFVTCLDPSVKGPLVTTVVCDFGLSIAKGIVGLNDFFRHSDRFVGDCRVCLSEMDRNEDYRRR